jgi:hypothetical protein
MRAPGLLPAPPHVDSRAAAVTVIAAFAFSFLPIVVFFPVVTLTNSPAEPAPLLPESTSPAGACRANMVTSGAPFANPNRDAPLAALVNGQAALASPAT